MNSSSSKIKRSKIEVRTQYFIIAIFVLELIACLIGAIYSALWNVQKSSETEFYLHWKLDESPKDKSVALNMLNAMGSWLLIFTDFVPISLLVTLEVVKFF
jgi:phospholipid-transporting ATPase